MPTFCGRRSTERHVDHSPTPYAAFVGQSHSKAYRRPECHKQRVHVFQVAAKASRYVLVLPNNAHAAIEANPSLASACVNIEVSRSGVYAVL